MALLVNKLNFTRPLLSKRLVTQRAVFSEIKITLKKKIGRKGKVNREGGGGKQKEGKVNERGFVIYVLNHKNIRLDMPRQLRLYRNCEKK